MKPSILKFLQLVQEDCWYHGVEIIFYPDTEIKISKNISVSGFWSDEDLELSVAAHNSDWLTVLAHEYGHFCQWKEKKFIDENTINAYNLFDDWIEKDIELTESQLDQVVHLIQKCELDCEKRALKFITKYKLYMYKDLYTQKANSYVLGFAAAKVKRKWFKTSPAAVKSVCKSMPETFTKTLTPTKRQMNLILKNCF